MIKIIWCNENKEKWKQINEILEKCDQTKNQQGETKKRIGETSSSSFPFLILLERSSNSDHSAPFNANPVKWPIELCRRNSFNFNEMKPLICKFLALKIIVFGTEDNFTFSFCLYSLFLELKNNVSTKKKLSCSISLPQLHCDGPGNCLLDTAPRPRDQA